MNKTMIICIDCDIYGNKHISDIIYDEKRPYIDVKQLAKDAKEYHHEVYIVDIDNYDNDFINAITKEGYKI